MGINCFRWRFFFLSILTVTCVLCWPNQCNSLTWRGKGVYSKCERSFLFWRSHSPRSPPTPRCPYTCVSPGRTSPPEVRPRSPVFWDGASSRVGRPPRVVGGVHAPFCLLFLRTLGCRHRARLLFPFQGCPGTVPLQTVEPCRDAGSHMGRDRAAFSTLFTDFSIRKLSATQLSPHSIAFCRTNRPWSDLPFCVEKKEVNNNKKMSKPLRRFNNL